MTLVLDGPATITSGADLVITWSPSSADPMKWYARERNGIDSDEGAIDDDVGMLTFPCDVIATLCTPDSILELKLQRFRSTDAADGFAAGNVTVRRFASAEIRVTN